MSKCIEINYCMSCPHHEMFLGGDLNGNWCTKKSRRKIEKVSVIDTVPKWCPLEDKK